MEKPKGAAAKRAGPNSTTSPRTTTPKIAVEAEGGVLNKSKESVGKVDQQAKAAEMVMIAGGLFTNSCHLKTAANAVPLDSHSDLGYLG